MGTAMRLAIKYGRHHLDRILKMLGQGWTVSQIEHWLKKHL